MESMVDATFDSGFYSRVSVKDTKGRVLLSREREVKIEGVPKWFIDHLPMLTPTGSAVVVSGWRQLGSVEVEISPGLAIREYWYVIREQTLLFVVIAVIACLSAGYALKLLLKPLEEVERQAESVTQRKFIIQEYIPRTRELRQVVLAMNKMAHKLAEVFREQMELIENLRLQTYIDPVTFLSNRSHFDSLLNSIIDRQKQYQGVMLLIQIGGFASFNRKYGRETGDRYLYDFAQKLKGLFNECHGAIIGRRGGIDFAVYLPGFSVDRTKILATELVRWSGDCQSCEVGKYDLPVHIGIAHTEHIKKDHSLFHEADLALSQAQARVDSSWEIYKDNSNFEIARMANQWYQLLNRAVTEDNFTFYYQPVYSNSRKVIASEVLCRLQENGELIAAGQFFPMILRFGLNTKFDTLVLNKILKMADKATGKVKNSNWDDGLKIIINLSPQSLLDDDFVGWLGAFLRVNPLFAKNLVLETSESIMSLKPGIVEVVCGIARESGAGFALDHFGMHSVAISYLESIPFEYVKIDRAFIKDIHLSKNNQFYVRSLVQIAHSRDVKIYAEGIEKAEEWATILNLGFDGGQGYFLKAPSANLT